MPAPVPDIPAPVRVEDSAVAKSSTDRMVEAIADQLCMIVADNYDIRIAVDADEENLQVQKLTVLINSLLENVRRNIGSLSELAGDLESKVQERTLKLDLVVQGSNDGVWFWNLDNNTVEYSKRWAELVGLDAEELTSIEDWLTRVHPDDEERLRAALREHLQGVKPHLREDYRIRHSDGTYRWMWCRGRCHRGENGRATFMAGTQTDVHRMRSIDSLTGLPNELALMAALDDMITAGLSFYAFVIAVPRIDAVNDEVDSEELSSLRRAIAQRLSSRLPFGADLAHLSGDFYAAVVPREVLFGDLEEIVISPLLSAFEKPVLTKRQRVWLDITIGATMPIGKTGHTAADVMRDAWTSYRAARLRRVRSNMLSADQIDAARSHANMEQLVRMALERDWFVPHFQPIVDISAATIRGFETLCRLEHPDQGIIMPGDFISVAERLSVMDQISVRMLDRALDLLGEWSTRAAPYDGLFLTVNLEPQQILQTDLPLRLEKALKQRKIRPELLKIEIVESSVIGNFETAARQIATIRAMGIQIALDDFGTGYSSLEYLNQLSFDLIKIDKTFVDGIETDGRKRSMIKMMSVLANALGADVCVEGIESDPQARVAEELGIKFAQGFLYSRPVAQSQIDELLGGTTGVKRRLA
ncbi:bifunctional diguanylate cyclase/phosphodiesterase [uncultured Roseobacter sp.]|uniref:putative bifunctional diguanylate cyclase/phosphodiesterase n=1 Tax=uncultured Roseobacter sp. TaxID=114847 RepID=UPI002626A5B4|nr:GGDEF domain-containing phosphodiesterase [uncultured Roseobacter sp.]